MSGRVVGVVALLAVGACSSDRSGPVEAAVEPAALVTIAEASPDTSGGSLLMVGTVRAKRETALAFNSNGRIATILVDGGDRVSKGQLLAQLDPAAITAEDAAARAETVRADAELKRMTELNAKGWVAKSRVETAQAAASSARARVASVAFNLRYSRIYAPSAGTILKRHLEPGQIVAAGTPVVSIGEAGEGFVLRAPLSDAGLSAVRAGQQATVSITALGAQPLIGRVTEVAGRGDERTGTFEVEIGLPPTAGLRSGLIGEARVSTGAAGTGRGVTIPASAVWQARADEGFVYVVDPATMVVRSRVVQLGALNDRMLVVSGGLKAGEQVAASGIERIRDGGKVRLK